MDMWLRDRMWDTMRDRIHNTAYALCSLSASMLTTGSHFKAYDAAFPTFREFTISSPMACSNTSHLHG
jgi:hypothetical protein